MALKLVELEIELERRKAYKDKTIVLLLLIVAAVNAQITNFDITPTITGVKQVNTEILNTIQQIFQVGLFAQMTWIFARGILSRQLHHSILSMIGLGALVMSIEYLPVVYCALMNIDSVTA